MWNPKWLRLGGVALLAAWLASAAGVAAGGSMGSVLTYQGQLIRDGAPVSGTCDFTFGLWDQALDGVEVGTPQELTLPVTNGLFTARLDFGPGIFDGGERWLAVAVRCPAGTGDYVSLSPREELTPVPYALRALSAPWSGLEGVPADLADGDQNTTYLAGQGLRLTDSEFSADLTVLQRRIADACPDGQYLRQIEADGGVQCAADTGVVFAPGAGLSLKDGVLAADETLARTADVPALADAAGFLTQTEADGLYQVDAGAGLTRMGNTVSVATDTVQARINGYCDVGNYVRAVEADGTVICGPDANSGGTITGVTAGFGLTAGGTDAAVTLSADPDALQRRVSGSCSAGEKILAIRSDGQVTCAADADSQYTAGTGLVLTGTTFSVDNSLARLTDITPIVQAAGFITQAWADLVYQARVTGSCAPGSMITAIAADGTVTCDPDRNTTYAAGDGLSLAGTTFSADGTLARLTDITPTVQAAGFITQPWADGTYQVRVSDICADGAMITAIWGDGTVTCAQDSNTTYTAGSGLTLAGTTFSADSSLARLTDITPTVRAAGYITQLWADATYQARVTGSCAPGSMVTAIAGDGTLTCGADTNTTYMPGDGLSLVGTTFTADSSLARLTDITPTVQASGFITQTWADDTYQARVTGTCAAGTMIVAIAADGTVTCAQDSNTIYSAGSGLGLVDGEFAVRAGGITTTMLAPGAIGAAQVLSTAVQLRVSGTCSAGQYIQAVAPGGTVTCGSDANSGGDITSVSAGAGLTGGADIGDVNLALAGSYRLPQSCAAGQVPVSDGAGGWTCQNLIPTGTIAFFAQSACPGGWSEVTALRGRALVGLPASGTVNGSVGTALSNRGTVTAALTIANLPAHTHDVDPASVAATTASAGAHSHTTDPAAVTTSSSGASSHTAYGGGAAWDGTGGQALAYGNITAGTGQWIGGLISSNPSHTHTVDIPATMSDIQGAHTHTVTVDVPNTTSTSTGSGAAFDVTMPYLQLLACSRN